MNRDEMLACVLERVAAAAGAAALFSERELAEWPTAPLSNLKAEGLLVKGTPANAVICPGCEEDCPMPVEYVPLAGGDVNAFVVCDKRDDIGRVAIARDLVEQWTCSPERVADVLARLLNTHRSEDAVPLRWELGVLKGTQQNGAHVVLEIKRELRLSISGHSLPLADVLVLANKGLTVERKALVRCVDNPVAGAGNQESAEQRRERLRTRRNELKSSGVRNFNQVLAQEEGITVWRIKQLLKAEKTDQPSSWFNLPPKGATQKKTKAQR